MWRTLAERRLLTTARGFRVVEQTVALPDGRVVEDYLQVLDRDFASIVAIDVEGRLVALEQYRHGVGAVCLALPGGGIDPGEAAEQAARRELLEETGYQAGRWRSLGEYVLHGARGVARGSHFLALDCQRIAEPTGGDLEASELRRMALSDAKTALLAGRFPIMSHAAALGGALLVLAEADQNSSMNSSTA